MSQSNMRFIHPPDCVINGIIGAIRGRKILSQIYLPYAK